MPLTSGNCLSLSVVILLIVYSVLREWLVFLASLKPKLYKAHDLMATCTHRNYRGFSRKLGRTHPLLCRSRVCGLGMAKEQINWWGWHKANSVVLLISSCPTTAMRIRSKNMVKALKRGCTSECSLTPWWWFHYQVDISTTIFSYSRAAQYCMGVIARALGLCGILATTMCFINRYIWTVSYSVLRVGRDKTLLWYG